MNCFNEILSPFTIYTIDQINGQRITRKRKRSTNFDLNSSDNMSSKPEIYISQIPHYMSESDLMPLFLSFGDVHQFRLMVKFSGHNRGYGYLSYENDCETFAIVNFLNDFEFCNGKRLRATISNNECRLYLANFPLSVLNCEIEQLLGNVTDPVKIEFIYKYKTKSVILTCRTHKDAALARRILQIELSVCNIYVRWYRKLNQ